MPPDRPPPPTIGDLRAMGMEGIQATCATLLCRHSAYVTFDALGMSDEMPFPQIQWSRRFRCERCGGRKVEASPDWRKVRMIGDGRPME